MDRLSREQRFAKIQVFIVDFDSSKDLLRKWKVSQQSTLVAFKGRTEKLRSTAEVAPETLRKLFEAAL